MSSAELSRFPGYLTPTKAALCNAMERVFGDDFPDPEYRNLLVSLEFPAKKESYPSIWVDFSPGAVEDMGVNHQEFYVDANDVPFEVRRWKFTGTALFTIVALTALERDRLFDFVTAHVAFGPRSVAGMAFRAAIEENDLVALDANYGSISVQGASSSLGTPWGTNDPIYEITVALTVLGEFAALVDRGDLAILSEVQFFPYRSDEAEEVLGGLEDSVDDNPFR